MDIKDIFNILKAVISDKVKKIILYSAIGTGTALIILTLILGFNGVNIPGVLNAIMEVLKILSAIVAIITAKISE